MAAGPESQAGGYNIEGNLLPLEEMLEIGKQRVKLNIGIPREIFEYEFRTPLTPQAVEYLVKNGHTVLIEKGAGEGANYPDLGYSEAGAIIKDNKEEIFKCDIIVKVAPLKDDEIELLKKHQIVLSSLQISSLTDENLKNLMTKKVTAIAYELIKEGPELLPVIRSMCEISGTASIIIAAELLSNVHKGKGVLLGGIPGITPAEVTILGTGTAAEYAARAALGLGALIRIFDNSISKLRDIQNRLGERVFTSVFHPQVFIKALRSADVVIGAMDLIEDWGEIHVTEEMVKKMKNGSVIIDLGINHGGIFETSEPRHLGNPTFIKHGVTHYCVGNISSRVARTASIALSNVFSPVLLKIGESGGIKNHLKENIGLRQGVYIYNGILTSKFIGNKFKLRAQDIDLLMSVF